MEIKLGICIVFFEKVDQTIDCIKSVIDSPAKLYVLNNNSSKSSLEKLNRFCSPYSNISIINSDINLGPAKGRNRLIEITTEPWLFFLDNDITIKKEDWFNKINAHIRYSTDIEVFIPRLFNVHENKWVEYHEYELIGNTVAGKSLTSNKTNWFPGGAAIVNRSLFSRIGLYNNSITVLEDFELSIRAIMQKQPIESLLISDIELMHDHQYAKLNKDKTAIKTRYSTDQYKFAENYIQETYKIEFHSGWQEWVNEQLEKMIYKSPYQKSKRWLSKTISGVNRRIKD